MLRVKKRNGNIIAFDIKKIEDAIEAAFIDVKKEYSKDIIELLALRVTSNFLNKVKGKLGNLFIVFPKRTTF